MTNDTKTEPTDTSEWPEFREGEELVEVIDELLWRQVHPNHMTESVVDGLAFDEIVGVEAMTGTPAARDEVSTDRSLGPRGISAQAAYDAWVQAERKTVGTFAVSVGEVNDAGGRVIDDSNVLYETPAPSHAYIDLRGLSLTPRARKRRVRSELAHAATVRKRQHPRTRK